MTCAGARLELGGYVLDGLPADEASAVEAHLAVCAGCREEYEELRGLPDLLALARDIPAPPPAALRERVLSTAAEARMAARRRARRRNALRLVAALLVGAVLGGGAVWLWPSSTRSVVAVALEPGSGFETQGTMELHPTDNGVRIQLELEALAPLDGDEVYEAWFAPPDTGPLSVGTFRPDADGTAEVTLWAAGPIQRYESMWVTLEPDFTDPAHDGPTVVAARLP